LTTSPSTPRIALEPGQAILLVVDLVALALPFLFGGTLVGAMLRAATEWSGRTYGASLLGSAAGSVLAPLAIESFGSAPTDNSRSRPVAADDAPGAQAPIASPRSGTRARITSGGERSGA
jgi:hypothetical protein